MTEISLFKHQTEFIEESTKDVYLQAGVASGKTHVLGYDIILNGQRFPGMSFLVVASEYKQLHDATMTEFIQILEDFGIKHNYTKSSPKFNIFFGKKPSTVFLRSSEAPGSIRGITVGLAYGDEAAFWSNFEDTFKASLSRTRGKGTGQMKLVSSGNGFNQLFDLFDPEGERYSPDRRLIKARTIDNTAPRFDAKGNFINTIGEKVNNDLKNSLSPIMYLQEAMGEFISLNNDRVFHTFDRNLHVSEVEEPTNEQILIGIDFNVGNMSAVCGYMKDEVLHIFEEIHLTDYGSDTEVLGNYLLDKFGNKNVILFPDASGKNRTANSTRSSHDILRNLGFKLKYPSKNPKLKDRFELCNFIINNDKVVFDKKCKKLNKDLERLKYKEESDDVDETDKSLKHFSDAFGYLVWKNFSIRVKRKSEVIR